MNDYCCGSIYVVQNTIIFYIYTKSINKDKIPFQIFS